MSAFFVFIYKKYLQMYLQFILFDQVNYTIKSMTKLILKTQSQRPFHEYDTIDEAVSAGKMLNFTIAMSLNVANRISWIEMCINDEIPRFYIEGQTGMECVPEF